MFTCGTNVRCAHSFSGAPPHDDPRRPDPRRRPSEGQPRCDCGAVMASILDLAAAVEELVNDGDQVAFEGFTHLIPFAAAHEVIRQRRRDLTLVRLTPDLIYDQLIGMGCARKLVYSWAGNPGVGSLHRFRDAVERGWPHDLETVEYTHAALTNRYVAGASGLPFAVLRGYAGTDLERYADGND